MNGMLMRSFENNEKIEIIYLAANGALSQREITVRRMNETHAICYCHHRRQCRMFKLGNILSAYPASLKKRAK